MEGGIKEACLSAFLLYLLQFTQCTADSDLWTRLRLPDEHIPYYFYNNKHIRGLCSRDPDCPYKVSMIYDICFSLNKLGFPISFRQPKSENTSMSIVKACLYKHKNYNLLYGK